VEDSVPVKDLGEKSNQG
jgi:hypothetical protein